MKSELIILINWLGMLSHNLDFQPKNFHTSYLWTSSFYSNILLFCCHPYYDVESKSNKEDDNKLDAMYLLVAMDLSRVNVYGDSTSIVEE